MSNKWRVSYGKNKVLGHFAAKTPEEAVDKAIARYEDTYSFNGESVTTYENTYSFNGEIYTAVRAGNADAVEYTVMR